MEGKTVSSSAINDQMIEINPADLTPGRTLFAGKVMQIADEIASTVAKRHCEMNCVAVGIDSVKFINPARLDDVLLCKSSVNRSWNTSFEVGVKIIAENFRSLDQREILSAYFTFVCVDLDHNTVQAPSVIAETDEEKRRYYEADLRRAERLKSTNVGSKEAV